MTPTPEREEALRLLDLPASMWSEEGVALVKHEFRALAADLDKWLAWSGGQYPDDSPGDVIAAEADVTIVLDDGITTWNPLRALAKFAADLEAAERERDEALARIPITEFLAREAAERDLATARGLIDRAALLLQNSTPPRHERWHDDFDQWLTDARAFRFLDSSNVSEELGGF